MQMQVPSRVGTPQTQVQTQPVLRLRGATREQEREVLESSESEGSRARRRIQWAEDVIDNEGLGRKKSKGSFSTIRVHVRACILC